MSELRDSIALYEIDKRLENIEMLLMRKDLEQTTTMSNSCSLYPLLMYMLYNNGSGNPMYSDNMNVYTNKTNVQEVNK